MYQLDEKLAFEARRLCLMEKYVCEHRLADRSADEELREICLKELATLRALYMACGGSATIWD